VGPRSRSPRVVAHAVLAVLAVAGGVLAACAAPPPRPATAPADGPRHGARILVYGDSLTWDARAYLPGIAAAMGVQVEERSFPGVAICDYLPDVRTRVRDHRPDVVVLAFYGNSRTPCMTDGAGGYRRGRDKAEKYEADATVAARLALRHGADVVLVGAPRSRDQMRDPGWERVRNAYRRVAQRYPERVSFADAGHDIAPGGVYTETQPCLPRERDLRDADGARPCRANRIVVRSSDGLHFCPDALDIVDHRAGSCPTYMSGAYRYGATIVSSARAAFARASKPS
jgi:hypothetical protein